MDKIGEKIIDGKFISLDKEPIGNLEKLAKKLEEKEETVKYDLDGTINSIINE